MARPYRCDLRLRGVGRIAQLTGATTAREHRARVAILRELYAQGQWAVLEHLRSGGRFTVPDVVGAYRAGRLVDLMASLTLEQPLAAAVKAWLPTSAPSNATRTRYEVSWGALQRAAKLTDTTPIGALLTLPWRAVQEAANGGPHHWKHLRGFVSRFLSDHVDAATRRRILDAMPGVPPIPGRVPDLTPTVFWKLIEAMPEHVRAAPVAIVATGMRLGEFLACREEHLLPLTHQLHIPGTKTAASNAVVPIAEGLWPWVQRAIPCPVGPWRLRELWRRACAAVGVVDVRLHDLRHLFAQWLVNEGVPEEAVQRAFRHTTAEMTRRYARQRSLERPAEVIAQVLGCHVPAKGPETGNVQGA